MATILIADDEAKMRKILNLALMDEGYDILEAKDADSAIEVINSTSLSLIITDLRMPGGGGMAVLEAVKKIDHYIPIIILTAYGTVENAVDALKNGAHDYLLKPCDLDEIKLSVRKALEFQRLEQENKYLRVELDQRLEQDEIIGKSASMIKVLSMVRRLARVDGIVLIRGENGSGKELVARAIHRQSPRSKRPFVTANCSSTPPDILELELFGHMWGKPGVNPDAPATGKFSLANGGTLFLDEIGYLPPSMQGKILRTIEDKTIEPVGDSLSKKIDVRIIASTNQDLEVKVQSGEIRSDFYFHLNVLPITVPPLRERKEDVPLLIEHFLKKKQQGRSTLSFLPDDIKSLMQYHWPGNVRELQNIIERAVVMHTTELNELLPSLHPALTTTNQMNFLQNELFDLSYKEAKKNILDEFEKIYFTHLLKKTGGNISRAAQLAQVHRKNFYVKISELGIDSKEYTQNEPIT